MARSCSTICLPVAPDLYRDIVGDPRRFRDWLDGAYRDYPELFPRAFAGGYRLKDARQPPSSKGRSPHERVEESVNTF